MRAGTRLAVLLMLVGPAPVAGQGFLEQFSYEGLRLTGIGLDAGVVFSDRLATEPTGALRIDYGFIAPNVRTLFGVSYFRSRFDDDEIQRFEQQIAGVVTGTNVVVDVGAITWTNIAFDIDLQRLFGPGRRVTPYLGLGIGVHFRNGSGTAIDGTFVEDALDTVAAGLNVSTGLEITVTGDLRFTLDGRGLLTSELRAATARAGLMLRLPRRAVTP